jgi:hypothetical protein
MTVDVTTSARARVPRNPYVGPFPFGPDQRLPNREREAQEVADLVVAERVVLLHAPSGAGKTSLIQAAVLPILDNFRIAGPVRVGKPVPIDNDGRPYEVHNRYVNSIAVALLCDRADPLELSQLSLPEAMKRALPAAHPGQLPLLVIDQLEEVLTLDPTDWSAKERFFRELGAAVADEGLWVLLAMREDYMGGLDRYLRFVPGHLRARYRLDFLTHKEALAAIQKPAKAQDVTVTNAAAWALVEKLARTKVQSPQKQIESKPTPYVEPFQLQVVCRRLWKDVRKEGDFRTIEEADVEKHVDVERALSRYYADSVAEIAKRFQVNERHIRDWFETQLITVQGFRSQTTTGPVTDKRADQILAQLTEMFLINGDPRGTSVWYELAHDRLIPAVRDNNKEWRVERLAGWQSAAFEWQANNRRKAFLLPPEQLLAAPSARRKDLAGFERDFLEASQEEAGSRFRLRRYRAASTLLALIAIAELVVILLLLYR